MKILVVSNNYVQSMRMMPVVEEIVKITDGKSLYCATCEYDRTNYRTRISEVTKAEFERRKKILVGKPYLLKTEVCKVINSYLPDLIFWWNGVLVGGDVVPFIKSKVPTVFCEIGFFPQREYLFVDKKGINCLSSIRDKKSPSVNRVQRDTLHQRINEFKAKNFVISTDFNKKDYIFIPLQLEHDSQIVKFAKFKRNRDLINFVSKAFPNESIVVKPHPLDANKSSYVLGRNNVEVVQGVNTHHLINNSKYVIGNNSTVLIESLLYDKIVVAFGKGIFTGKGVVLEAHDNVNQLAQIENFELDCDLRDNFIYDLLYRYQIKVGSVNSNNVIDRYDVDSRSLLDWCKSNRIFEVNNNKIPFSTLSTICQSVKIESKSAFRKMLAIARKIHEK